VYLIKVTIFVRNIFDLLSIYRTATKITVCYTARCSYLSCRW